MTDITSFSLESMVRGYHRIAIVGEELECSQEEHVNDAHDPFVVFATSGGQLRTFLTRKTWVYFLISIANCRCKLCACTCAEVSCIRMS